MRTIKFVACPRGRPRIGNKMSTQTAPDFFGFRSRGGKGARVLTLRFPLKNGDRIREDVHNVADDQRDQSKTCLLGWNSEFGVQQFDE